MQDSKSLRLTLVAIAALLNGGAVMVARAILQAPPNILLCLVFGALFAVVFNGVAALFRHSEHRWIFFAVIAVFLLILWRIGTFVTISEIAARYVIWFREHDLSNAGPENFAIIITMLIAGLISSLYTTPLVARKPRILPALAVFMTIIIMPYSYIDHVQMRTAVIIIIFALLYLTVLSGYFRISRRYNGKIHSRPYQTIGLALCAVITFTAAALPFSDDRGPIGIFSWAASDNAFFRFFVPGTTRYMTLNDTDEVRLGGSNNDRMSNVLLFDVRTDELFYLYADTYDRYTGSSWESTSNERMMYHRERYRDIWQIDEYAIYPNLSDRVQLSFLYHNLTTDRLLLPKRLEAVNITSGNHVIYMKDDLTLSVNTVTRGGFTYEAWAYKRNLSGIMDYIELSDQHGDITFSFHPDGSIQLSRREHFDQERYLKLPDSVTERTRELAWQITAGEISNIRKALAIQKYLSETYPYTLDAPDLPEGTDFVDFFLFEAKTGYCTSYASAMVVMLRTLGIPARYCEGFAPSQEHFTDGVYRVYEENAHAWVEMYTPYGGWIELDPTGSDNAAVFRAQQLAPRPEINYEPNYNPQWPSYEDEARAAADRYSQGNEIEIPDEEETVSVMTNAEILIDGTLRIAAIALIPVLWILGGRLYVRIKLVYIKKKSPTKQACFWYGRILGLLKGEGFVSHQYESMRAFIARVREDLPSSANDLLPAIALMERVVYNEGEIASEEIAVFADAHNQLLRGLHAGWGRIRQWVEKNITFRILWYINL